LWNVVGLYNSKYGFGLSDDLGQAQLTRYRSGQHYEWHMDLGSRQLRLRKITAVAELAPKGLTKGGGLEIFFGETLETKSISTLGTSLCSPRLLCVAPLW
jgi:Rps23 Pro-64 3,4-dihydroxylase Tpa1-like proline 4-hydroxylase